MGAAVGVGVIVGGRVGVGVGSVIAIHSRCVALLSGNRGWLMGRKALASPAGAMAGSQRTAPER